MIPEQLTDDVIASVVEGLDRRRLEYKRVGWLYVLRNAAFAEQLFKIGRTNRPPWQRASEISSATGVPSRFEVVYYVHVTDTVPAERHVHSVLGDFRKARGKEFFLAPLSEAVFALDDAAARFPISLTPGGLGPFLPQRFPTLIANCVHCAHRVRIKKVPGLQARCPGCKTKFVV
jgi:hypothetical protein